MFEKVKEFFTGNVRQAEAARYHPLNPEIYKEYNRFRPQGPQKLFCYVPFSNMSFSFEGRVLACAYNQKVELGRYPQQSIREMWFESEMGNTLRAHMRHNDLSYGCKHCKYFFDNRKFSGLKPLVFDRYNTVKGNGYPRVMEFELSSTCNLECVMCNGKVSSSIRKNRDKLPPIKSPYDDAFAEQLNEFIPHLEEAKFYGGEPLLIPLYYRIWDMILDTNPRVKLFVITNGTTLNDRIKALLERGNFDLAVSLDSPRKEILESIRLNTAHETVMENIAYFNDYCKRKGKNLVISFTLMRINWREFPKIIRFCNAIDAILYVSYLKTPPQYALWNLPVGELAYIREQLQGESFPDATHAEKNNKRCYEDLLTYLGGCEETNKTRPENEIMPFYSNGENKTPESTADAAPAQAAAQAQAPAFEARLDYAAVVKKQLEDFLRQQDGADMQKVDAFFHRIHAVLTRHFHFSADDRNRVFYSISIFPIDAAYRDVFAFSEQELKDAIERVAYLNRQNPGTT